MSRAMRRDPGTARAPESMRRRRHPKLGFTIAEVLITVAIMSLILVAITRVLNSVRVTRDRIHNIQETQLAGPVIIDMIVRDLRGIHVMDRPRASHLSVADRVEYGLDADRIDFVTTTNSREARVEGDQLLRADICEVGYMARVRPDDDQFLELYRREDFGVDDEPFSGGRYTFLSDRVKSLTIDVYQEDGPDIEPLPDWGGQDTDEEFHGLPAWVEIRLTLENTPRLLREQIERSSRERATVVYTRSYRFPQGLRFEDESGVPSYGIPVSSGGEEEDPTDTEETEPEGGTDGGAGGQGGGQGADPGAGPGTDNS